jgi:hypothetical protein
MASQTSPAAITNMFCNDDIEKLTKCYAHQNKTYADMSQDKTPLHIRGDECVRNDALCVPQDQLTWFLKKQTNGNKDADPCTSWCRACEEETG